MKGWVYVITNDAMPGLVKVGFTMKDPESRARQLNNTGSPHPYLVCYELLAENPQRIEGLAHEALCGKNENKEWFRCSVEEAISAIKRSAGEKTFTEIYTRADRLKAEAIQEVRHKSEHNLENAKRNYQEALEKISIRRDALDSAARRQFESSVKPVEEKLSFWLFWLIGAGLVILLLEWLLGGDAEGGAAILAIILGFFLGGFLRDLALERYPEYKNLVGLRDRKLKSTSLWYEQEHRKLNVNHDNEKLKIESTRDSDLKKLSNPSGSPEGGDRVKTGRKQHPPRQRTDSELTLLVSCKNCGQKLKIRPFLGHTKSNGVRWRCPVCTLVWRG